MSRRIVSWKISEPRVSPAVSSASGGSVVSINSIFSDMMTTETTAVQPAELGAKFTNWPGPGSAKPPTVDSFVKHDIFFIKDGNVTFLVDGTLYCVHRYFLSRDSEYFSTKFSQLDVRDHEALTTIISLGDVERKDFEAFLSALYFQNFEEHDLSYEQWKSVLHLSTRWGFASLRKLALKSMDPPTAFDRLLLARTYDVDHWVLPALSALCERKRNINVKEIRQMNAEDIFLVTTMREEICTLRPFLSTTEIESRIEALQVRMATHLANDDDSAVDLEESEADEKEPLKFGIGPKVDGHKNIAVAIQPKVVDENGSGEPSTRITGDSSAAELLAAKKKRMAKKRASRLGCNAGEDAGAHLPETAPIAGEGEEKYDSEAIPKEEKESTPNPIIHGSVSWLSKLPLATQAAIVPSATGMPPEGSPSVPVKDSQRVMGPTPGSSSSFDTGYFNRTTTSRKK